MTSCFDPFPMLYTGRLILRTLEPQDSDRFFMLKSDPETMSAYYALPLSREQAEAKMKALVQDASAGRSITWAVTAKEEPSKLLGTVCLWNYQPEANSWELGYDALPEARGRGSMGEAAAEVVNFALYTLNAQKVDACPGAENTPSIRLLERLGFSKAAEFEDDGNQYLLFSVYRSEDE